LNNAEFQAVSLEKKAKKLKKYVFFVLAIKLFPIFVAK